MSAPLDDLLADTTISWSLTDATPNGITIMLHKREHVAVLQQAIQRYVIALEEVGNLNDDHLEALADHAQIAVAGMDAGVSEWWAHRRLYAVAATVRSLLRFTSLIADLREREFPEIDFDDLAEVDSALQLALKMVAAERLAEQKRLLQRIGGAS